MKSRRSAAPKSLTELMKMIYYILLLSLLGWSEGKGDPDLDCSQVVGFTSIGIKKIHPSNITSFSQDIFNSNHGWVRDTGTFTVRCPGIYSISFTTHGNSDTRFTLQIRPTTTAKPTSIVSTALSGGSHTILYQLSVGEQINIYALGSGVGSLEQTGKINSFSAYKINS